MTASLTRAGVREFVQTSAPGAALSLTRLMLASALLAGLSPILTFSAGSVSTATVDLLRRSPSNNAANSLSESSMQAAIAPAQTDADAPTGRVATITLPLLHAGQQRIRDACNRARFTTAVCGRRVGKTHFGVRRFWKRATAIGANYQALWAAPTFDLTHVATEEWARLFPVSVYGFNRTEHLIRLVTGGRIYFRSADNPDSFLGRGYDDAIIDEAARVSRDAIERAILPTLADRNGRALAITTPAGKRSWVFEWYQRGLDDAQSDWASAHAPSTENPAVAEWCRQMAPLGMDGGGGMPLDIYRQEILAEFLDDAAAVFRNVRACVEGDLSGWAEAMPDVIGVDVAKHQDFTVLTGMADRGGKRRVVCWDRFHRLSWPLQVERIAAASKDAGNALVLVDATGVGDAVLDDLSAAGVNVMPYKFTNESKQRVIQSLVLDIEQGNVRYPEIDVLTGELEAYAYEITPLGAFKYNAPEGLHDDAVISLALANWALKNFSGPLVAF